MWVRLRLRLRTALLFALVVVLCVTVVVLQLQASSATQSLVVGGAGAGGPGGGGGGGWASTLSWLHSRIMGTGEDHSSTVPVPVPVPAPVHVHELHCDVAQTIIQRRPTPARDTGRGAHADAEAEAVLAPWDFDVHLPAAEAANANANANPNADADADAGGVVGAATPLSAQARLHPVRSFVRLLLCPTVDIPVTITLHHEPARTVPVPKSEHRHPLPNSTSVSGQGAPLRLIFHASRVVKPSGSNSSSSSSSSSEPFVWLPTPFSRCSRASSSSSSSSSSGSGSGVVNGSVMPLSPATATATASASSPVWLFDVGLAAGFNRIHVTMTINLHHVNHHNHNHSHNLTIHQYINIWNGPNQQQQQQHQHQHQQQRSQQPQQQQQQQQVSSRLPESTVSGAGAIPSPAVWQSRVGFSASPLQSSLLGNVAYLLRSVMDPPLPVGIRTPSSPPPPPPPPSPPPPSSSAPVTAIPPSRRVHAGYSVYQYGRCSLQSPDHSAVLLWHGSVYVVGNSTVDPSHPRHGHMGRTRNILALLQRMARDVPHILPKRAVFLVSLADEPFGLSRYPHDQDLARPPPGYDGAPQVDCPPVWGFTQTPHIQTWRDRRPQAPWRRGMIQAVLALPCFSFVSHADYFSWWGTSRRNFDLTFRSLPPIEHRNKQIYFRDGGNSHGDRHTYRDILSAAGHNTTGGAFTALRKQCRLYRYQVYPGGHADRAWSTRLKAQFLCGVPLLADRLTDPDQYYTEFWYPIVRPYIHFVPVTTHTLLQQYSLCEGELRWCSAIGVSGHDVIYDTLTVEFVYEYLAHMLHVQSTYVNTWTDDDDDDPHPHPHPHQLLTKHGIQWTPVPNIPIVEHNANMWDVNPGHA